MTIEYERLRGQFTGSTFSGDLLVSSNYCPHCGILSGGACIHITKHTWGAQGTCIEQVKVYEDEQYIEWIPDPLRTTTGPSLIFNN